MKLQITIALLAVLAIPFIFALSFLSNPSILEPSPDTTNALECVWEESGDTTQTNVSWFKDGVLNTTSNNIQGFQSSTLSSSLTSRGQEWTCKVNISDGSSFDSRNVSVTIQNAIPTVPVVYEGSNPISNITNVTEDVAYVFDVNSTDPDGDTIRYYDNVSVFDSGVDLNTGGFTWTPQHTDIDFTVQFQAQDGQTPTPGISALDMEFNIIFVNDTPEFVTSITDQNATEDVFFSYEIEVSDEENDPNNFSMVVTPSLPSLILNKANGFNFNITFNRTGNGPLFGEEGNYTVNLTVFDATNNSRNITDSFNLEVISVNQLPNMSFIPNASGTEDSLFTVQFNSTDGDINDTQTFSIQTVNCNLGFNPWYVQTTNASNNATGQINLTLNDSHVICPEVNISVQDSAGAIDYQQVTFNITNINDVPIIYNFSYYGTNTVGSNISNLTGVNGANFVYRINASDIDSQTYEGEVLTYTLNDSLFTINSANGLINFTANNSHVGNKTINVTVTDDESLFDWRLMIVEIKNNSIPQINNLTNSSCQEDVSCIIVVTATDGDSEAMNITENSTLFDFSKKNDTASILTQTFNNSVVGNYSVYFTATDVNGAYSIRLLNISINNTNDPPIFDGNQDNISDTVIFPTIVETYNFVYYLNATDEDLIYGDSLTFGFNNLSGNGSVINFTKISNNQALFNFTPDVNADGNYSINITINDSAGNLVYQVVNFTIFNQSGAPTITHVRPFNNGSAAEFDYSVNTFGSSMAINFSENRSVLFVANATDPDGDDLNYTWYVNNVENGTSQTKTYDFNFASAGDYDIRVVINDQFFETASFQWNLTVTNLNRAPELLNDLVNLTEDLTINGTTTYSSYLSRWDGVQRFYDADDDDNNNSEITGNETLNLNYNVSTCLDIVSATVATITITGNSLEIVPSKLGNCTVQFTATDDDGDFVNSNPVTISVSQLDSSTSETVEVITQSGGGGGGTSTVVVPLNQEVSEPAPLKIITPGRIVTYAQRIMEIPISVESNWTETLFGITLEASTNNTDAEVNLSRTTINSLVPGQSEDLILEVTNFRDGGPYEIYVTGNVESPLFTDTQIILVNSIEAAEQGETYETKISFARDFFDENKECQELNEVLERAEAEAEQLNYEQAIILVDNAINGCKYLVSQVAAPETQNPSYFRTLREFTEDNINFIIIGSAALLVVAIGLFFTRKSAFE